jgi:hypothetical protein
MVQACKDYVLQYTTSADVSQADVLWQRLHHEIANYNPSASSDYLQQKQLHAQLVNKLKVCTTVTCVYVSLVRVNIYNKQVLDY